MNCEFKYYKDGKSILASQSFEGLVLQLMADSNTEATLDQYMIDSLNFFSADGDNVSAVIENIKLQPQELEGKGLTRFLKKTLLGSDKMQSSYDDLSKTTPETTISRAQNYIDYCADKGTAYHECVDALVKRGKDSKEYLIRLHNLWEVLNRYKATCALWKGLGYTNAERSIDFLNSLTTEEHFNLTTLLPSLETVIREIRKDGNLVTELRLEDKKAYDSGLTGVFDAVTWDADGNVTIYDFKTTASNEVSTRTKLYRYALLRGYKEMLVLYSKRIGKQIPYDKVKIKNILIADSFKNGDEPTFTVLIINDPESEFKGTSVDYQAEINKELSILYPYLGKTLSLADLDIKKEKIKNLTNPIISELGVGKLAQEAQLTYIEKLINNKLPIFLHYLAENSWENGKTITKWKKSGNEYIGYDAGDKVLVKDTLENIADKEAKNLLENLRRKTKLIASALHIKSYDTIANFFKFDLKRLNSLLYALEPYLSNEYEYLKIEFLEDNYNIITLKNLADNSYSFLVMSDLLRIDHARKNATNLLEPVFKDQSVLTKFKEARELPFPNAQNINTLIAMLAINECKDLISNEPINIDRILVVSVSSGVHSGGTNIKSFTNALKLLEYVTKKNPNDLNDKEIYSDIYSSWLKNIHLNSEKEVLTKLVLNRISTFKFTHPDFTLDTFSSLGNEITQLHILNVITKIEEDFSLEEEFRNINTTVGKIYRELLRLLELYRTGEIRHELYRQTKYGLTAAETLGAGIDILKYGMSRRFSFNGMLLNGIAQGLETSISYSNPDQAVQYYEKIYRYAARQVTEELVSLAVPFNNATKKFLRESGKTSIAVNVIGNTTDVYESLFELENGKVSKNMQLKNPYDNSSELVPYLREYAKEVIWLINKLRISKMVTWLDAKYRRMSYAEFSKTEMHKNYVNLINTNPELLLMPLKLKNSTEGVIMNIRNLFDPDDSDTLTKSRLERFALSVQDRWLQSIEPVLLTPDLRSGMDTNIDESKRHFEYHSPYNTLGENRVIMLNNTPTNEWEKNLNILGLEYACALFKEIYFLLVLHTVGNLLGEIDLMEVMSGNDLSETKEALIKRLKISVYNQNLVDDELKSAASIVAGLKLVVSFTKLALRPATFIKEMILGIIRNTSNVIANNIVNDVPITFDHLMKAAGVVYTNGLFINNGYAPDDETFGDFRLVGALNNLYRINDRDLNLLGESISYDSHGLMHWGSRMLYLNTTSPDWFNRMTLLVAKMMADGSWEAHSLDKNGNIVYDPYKDKRFARFLSFYRNNPNLSEVSLPTDEEYVLSKARYTLTILQLKKEGYENLTANDIDGYSIIPVCYTTQEMDSFKEQVGMLYGYYSHEERTILLKSIAWLLHTLFLTFFPGEIKKYFASGNLETSIGKVIHLKDPFSGKKLYYKKNEAGLTEIVDEDQLTSNEKTDPVVEFVKVAPEGLIVSTAKTLSLVWHGLRADIPEEQWNRTKLFLFNMLIWALINAILVGMGVAIANNKRSKDEQRRQMDAVAASSRILRSVAQELNIFNIIESSVATMGITSYDEIKQITASTLNSITSNSRDWFDVLNQMGAVKDFQIS